MVALHHGSQQEDVKFAVSFSCDAPLSCARSPNTLLRSQVEVASHKAADTYTNDRVPSGFDFWSVRVRVTRLELVFLYRFLQELLGYISLTLALRPPALPSRGAATTVTDRASAAAASAVQAELLRGMGTVLQLDVTMEAPVITMPRNSSSPDKVRAE